MPVVFKGGTSGDGNDYTNGQDGRVTPQPLLDTSNNDTNPQVSWGHQPSGNDSKFIKDTPGPGSDFIPATGTVSKQNADGTLTYMDTPDTVQQDIKNIPNEVAKNDPTIYKGAKDTGVGGQRG